MSIYIHIPFCKQACSYCDFYFSTSTKVKNELINALALELKKEKDFFDDTELQEIQSIYFGGGTPSILNNEELDFLLENIHQNFKASEKAEITLEANPDDIVDDKLEAWKKAGINRLSIGIQAFQDDLLKLMNRAHNSSHALSVIKKARNYGFDNFTLDLIYGIPGLSLEQWKENLDKAVDMGVNHISCYALTVEKNTLLDNQVKKGLIKMPDDDEIAQQFELMVETLKKSGFEQYEISNFAKSGHYSKHNSSYWQNKAYLGIGPSAHSYKNNWRKWNISNNHEYIKNVNEKNWEKLFEEENLTKNDLFNEYIMTSIRTSNGISLDVIKNKFGREFLEHFSKSLEKINEKVFFLSKNENIVLNNKGKLISDSIAANLFID